MLELTIPDAPAMEALGARLAPLLGPGDLVLLNGELGAGKTTLTRGLGAALGARGAVTSPTFVLAREHPTASGDPLVHVDAYRVATGREFDDLDLDFARSIVVVEWGAGKVDGVSESWLSIDIRRPHGSELSTAFDPELDHDEPRQLVIVGSGPRGRALEAALAARG